MIGNGWIAPKEQYQAYLQFAYAKGLVQKGSETAGKLENSARICQQEMATSPDTIDNSVCESILQDLLAYTSTKENGKKMCTNMYDVRLKDTSPSCGMNWPPDLKHVTPYLRRKDVIQALNVNDNKVTGWTECNGQVGSHFRPQTSKPSIQLLPDLLKEVPILLFSGAEDLICNHLGTEALISNMEWNNGRGFEITPGTWAPRRDWTFEGEAAGFWQEARNLTYVLFNNASHMVPFDYPRRSRDMLDRFMKVDISNIGGQPTDSRLDGEKGPETTVGGAAGNSTSDQQAEKAKLDAAKWEAYRKSGEVVLVIVIIAAGAWGYFVWRERRKRAGYQGLAGGDGASGGGNGAIGSGLEGFRHKRNAARNSRMAARDVEAADFDESELDDLHLKRPVDATHNGGSSNGAVGLSHDRYSVGDDEDSDDEKGKRVARN